MLHELLSSYHFVLASSSPRRLELLRQLGLRPETRSAEIDEQIPNNSPDADDLVRDFAWQKEEKIAQYYKNDKYAILGADTVVMVDGRILGKPQNREAAKVQLQLLSGKTHLVKTGMAFSYSEKEKTFLHVETSEVTFKNISDREISLYLETGESMDKAGAYAIQGMASQFVKSIHGCYFNVVGLPVSAFYDMVKGAFNGR